MTNNIILALEKEQMKTDVPAFSPGDTVIVQVKVKEGVIKLYGEARNGTYPVLTIAKNKDMYVIKSFYVH